VLERRTVHIPDVRADPEFRRTDIANAGHFRTVLAVPMLREDEPVGIFLLTRNKAAMPFTDKQIELVTTFADQAVIAIENVRLFNEIQEKSQQLEIANRHKSQFLANMSHELRTPLNCINGFSEMLLARMFGDLNEKQEEFLRDINSSGEHLLALINDVLDLSKIEAGRMEIFLESFDPGITLDNTVMLVKERAARRGIAVNLSVDDQLERWVGDERKIRQVMLNLLSNAIKFTPEGGRIDVTATLDSNEMEVTVSDTGVGIKPEDQERIFEEFQQAGSDYTKKAEGTGLGLALTKKFIELHGGTIRVESAQGTGSTFTFRLPQMQEP
jgi:signal transduction histidine kinase